MTNNDKNTHRRFSPGDQAVLVCRCQRKDNCCIADHIGKVVTIVAYAEAAISPHIMEVLRTLVDVLQATFREPDYIIEVENGLALVGDYQLMPLGGYTKKNEVPEKLEVVH